MSYDPASGAWHNPPPPGTLDDQQYSRSSKDKTQGKSMKENYRRYSRSRSRSSEEYRRSRTRSFSRSRSRSRSRDHGRERDYHSKRHDRRRRSRSHKRYSHKRRTQHKPSRKYSRSRSRSYSRSRHHRRSYTRSRSRSKCKYSRSRSQSWSSSSYSDRESSLYRNNRSKNYVPEVPKNQDYIRKVYSKKDEVPVQENNFKNDGSFLEMFKKMQEEKEKEKIKTEPIEAGVSEVKKNPLPIFGKRRGGKVLKTGMVQKLKNPNEVEEEPKDAWSVYMKEVKRYKEACCDDDSKTRPLVK